jgi:hypothetical protein
MKQKDVEMRTTLTISESFHPSASVSDRICQSGLPHLFLPYRGKLILEILNFDVDIVLNRGLERLGTRRTLLRWRFLACFTTDRHHDGKHRRAQIDE